MRYQDYEKLVEGIGRWSDFQKKYPMFDAKTSYYTHKKLSENEILYLDLLSTSYNVKSPSGIIVPYFASPWQVDFHCNSICLNGEHTKNDYVMKGRGISFSYSCMIEAINVALKYKGTIIPIIAHRFQAANDLVKIAFWLVEHSNLRFDINTNKTSELELIHEDGQVSIIRPYPGATRGAVDAVRSLRPVLVIIDEAGIGNYLADMLAAVEDSMQTRETKVIVGGTPKGTTNHYWKMQRMPLAGYNKYFLPAFKETPTPETIENMLPLVWWFDIPKMKDKLINNPDKFMQENQAFPFDDSLSLIPVSYITEAMEEDLQFNFNESSISFMGIDIASTKDYAVITVFKFNGIEFEQTHLDFFKGMELPELENKIRQQIEILRPDYIRADATGMGLQLCQKLSSEYSNFKGVNFASHIKRGRDSFPIKPYMCNNFETLMRMGRVKLIKNDVQYNHIANVDKKLSFMSKDGHNDIFVADALACLPINFETSESTEELYGEKKKEGIDSLKHFLTQMPRKDKTRTSFGGYSFSR